jgi:predicted RNase H-like HicB family nuclease
MTLKVLIEPGEDGGLIAEVPALKGCRSQGRTRQELLENVREAITAWLETEQDKPDAGPALGDVELLTV